MMKSCVAFPLWGRLVGQRWVRLGVALFNPYQESQIEEMLKW